VPVSVWLSISRWRLAVFGQRSRRYSSQSSIDRSNLGKCSRGEAANGRDVVMRPASAQQRSSAARTGPGRLRDVALSGDRHAGRPPTREDDERMHHTTTARAA
jgi:hypothetical protein